MIQRLSAWVLAGMIGLGGVASAAQDGAVAPQDGPDAAALGFDPDRLAKLDAVVEEAVASGKVPGAVLVVGRYGMPAYSKAFG